MNTIYRCKFFFFFFILFVTSNVFSQACDEKFNNFFISIQEHNYEAAILKGKQAIESCNNSDTIFANTYRYLAYCFYATKNYDSAVEYYKQTQLLFSKLYGEKNNNYLQVTFNLAVNYTYIGKYSMAYPLMDEVLNAIVQNQGKNSYEFINTSNQLANIYNIAGSYDMAQKIYEDVFEIVKSNYQTSDSMYMAMVNIIAPFYFSIGKYSKAEPFYKQAVETMEKVYGKNSANYLASLNSLGEFYIKAGMYEKADTTFQHYVDLCSNFYGKTSAHHATALNNLAVVNEKQGKFLSAESMHLQALKIKENVFKKESYFYALSLSNLAILYNQMAKYKDAEILLFEAIDIYKKLYGEKSDDYANALATLASLYADNGNKIEAINLIKKAMDIQFKLYGEKYEAYITSVNNLALLYHETGKYDSAEIYFKKNIELRKIVQGSNHPDYAVSIFNYANFKTSIGLYKQAESLLNEAINIQKLVLGEKHQSYLNSLISIAGVYAIIGNYELAEVTYNKCKILCENLYGDMHPQYAAVLNNFGQFYGEIGDYENAEIYLRKSLEINQKAFGNSHPDNASIWFNLANTMMAIGNNKLTEQYLLASVKIYKENYGDEHPDYINALLGLGVFYYEIGNYLKSEIQYIEVIEKFTKLYGKNHQKLATPYNNLGALYLEMALYSTETSNPMELIANSESCLKKSLEIDSIAFGINHSDYATRLNNLAELYRSTNQLDIAGKYLLKSIKIQEQIFGLKHADLAISYHNLSSIAVAKMQYDTAEKHLMHAINIFKSTYGESNPNLADKLFSLAYIQQCQHNNVEASDTYLKALQMQYQNLAKNFSFLSEEEKANYIKTFEHYNDLFTAFALACSSSNPEITSTLFNNAMIYKGLLLYSNSQLRNSIFNSNQTELINKYQHWIGLKQQLAILYTKPKSDNTAIIDAIEENANLLEKELILKTNTKNEIENIFNQDWLKVKSNLKEGEAAIEFVKINYRFLFPEKIKDDSIGFLALIVKPESKFPDLVPLCNEELLQKIVGKYGWNDATMIKLIYAIDSKKGLRLYDYIWKPLEFFLTNTHSVYISPIGALNQISFATIPMENKQYLSERFQIKMTMSTRNIVNLHSDRSFKFKNTLVIGGIDYNADDLYLSTLANNSKIDFKLLQRNFFSDTSKYLSAVHWNYLAGTKTEAEQINNSLIENKIETNLLMGTNALEEKFKTTNFVDVIHIATHGFSFPPPKLLKKTFVIENNFSKNKNPLMRTGLILAGANRAWSGALPVEGIEDGVLTAYEVSNMNLQNTQLVVLSACETGLGDIKGSEGVYGLQRAFKMAGVKYIIMSLWQVPDKETVEFMTTFYMKLLKQKDIRKAFSETQNEMRKKYDPYYWAAFVLIE